jgi:hypothetical protein
LGRQVFELERESFLAFPVICRGQLLQTIGDAIALFSRLSPEQTDRHYWHRAVITVNTAIKCRQYLKTATINLQTAVLMDDPEHTSPRFSSNLI